MYFGLDYFIIYAPHPFLLLAGISLTVGKELKCGALIHFAKILFFFCISKSKYFDFSKLCFLN